MKKKLVLLICMIQIMILNACGTAAEATPAPPESIQTEGLESAEEAAVMTEEEEQTEEGTGIAESGPEQKSRVLIAYFSQPTDVDTSDQDAVSGASVVVRNDEAAGSTTEYVARLIQETIGGDLFRIETVEEYPSDYDDVVSQARAEKGDNARPELAGHIENLEQYDTIILGYPSWIMDLPMPVYYFLEEYDFGAKTIIPFVTHGGSGFGSTKDAISELQPGAFVSDNGLSVARDDLADMEGEIRQWAEGLELNEEQMPESEMEQGAGTVRITDTADQIPEDYYAKASKQGTLERLEYTTYESFSYEEHTRQLTKTAYVYLPFGYSEDKQYNVFYLMHGGWSNETTYLGTPENPNVLKNVVDHAVQDGRMEPVIIVCPTYNNENPNDSDDYGLALRLTDNYHNELLNDLVPAVEGKYSTYAEETSPQELERSRDHRAFCGFSMGSVTTWHTFEYCLPYFRYFLPSSGDLTSDGQYMESIVTGFGYGPEDFFIYAMSGTEDFDYSAFSYQIQAMLEAPGGIFIEADNEEEGNLAYRVQEGNEHSGEAALQYIYNGLVWLWK